MIRIWAKTFRKEKITNSQVVEYETTRISFFEMIRGICEKMDIATPVILNKHYEEYVKFNMTIFTKDDFVDSINFDRLVLERA